MGGRPPRAGGAVYVAARAGVFKFYIYHIMSNNLSVLCYYVLMAAAQESRFQELGLHPSSHPGGSGKPSLEKAASIKKPRFADV